MRKGRQRRGPRPWDGALSISGKSGGHFFGSSDSNTALALAARPVNRVELKNIIPPKDIQSAMEKQMKAERERRESVLQAQGQQDPPGPGARWG